MATRDVLKVSLRRLMESKRREVPEVARKAGVPVIEVYQALAGEFSATVDWLERVADALGVKVSELVRPE